MYDDPSGEGDPFMKPLYLASKSPQRVKLLRSLGLRFKIVSSGYREKSPLPGGLQRRQAGAAEMALHHAMGKVQAVGLKKGVVIAADTVVAFKGRIWGKPRNKRHAFQMLKKFSGKAQAIYTAVAIKDLESGRVTAFCDKSVVTFKKMTDNDILKYLLTGEYRGKAGAFGIQGKGSHLIQSVRGSHSNVVGLPLEKLKKALSLFF